VAIDQCERVLLDEPQNLKALYRISVALDSQTKPLEAWAYIKRAQGIDSKDKDISGLYSKVKTLRDGIMDERNKQNKTDKKEAKPDKSGGIYIVVTAQS
jgi:hypothetical protein